MVRFSVGVGGVELARLVLLGDSEDVGAADGSGVVGGSVRCRDGLAIEDLYDKASAIAI